MTTKEYRVRLLRRLGRGTRLGLAALDQSAAALPLARRTGANAGTAVGLIRGEGGALPIAAASYALVLSSGLLGHFADPVPVPSELVRVLRPGGVFYADVVPRRFSLYRLRKLPRLIASPWLMQGVYEPAFGPRHSPVWPRRLGCTPRGWRRSAARVPRGRLVVGGP